MEKDLTLLVLAAGMGSRFGGLKQIEPVGPNGEFIIDYSVYDAIKAGFNKVVFIIKEENYEVFKSTIGKRIEDKIRVEYVFQKISDVPDGVIIPKERIKPLGTAQAVYAARNVIHENFAIINADDFYGRDGYLKAAEFLKNCDDDEYANVAYEVGKTLTLNGAVKRGVIFENDGTIEKIVESSIERKDNVIVATPLEINESFNLKEDDPVSMNFLCLTPKIFDYLNNNMKAYYDSCEDKMTCECYIPVESAKSALENGKPMKLLKTDSKYYGITYREDLEELKMGIESEIEKGIYNSNLWR